MVNKDYFIVFTYFLNFFIGLLGKWNLGEWEPLINSYLVFLEVCSWVKTKKFDKILFFKVLVKIANIEPFMMGKQLHSQLIKEYSTVWRYSIAMTLYHNMMYSDHRRIARKILAEQTKKNHKNTMISKV